MKDSFLQFKLIILIFFSIINYSFTQNNCNCENKVLKNEDTKLNKRDSVKIFKDIAILKNSKFESCIYIGISKETKYNIQQGNLNLGLSLLKKQEELLKKIRCKNKFIYDFYINKAFYYHAINDFENLSDFAIKALEEAELIEDKNKEIESIKQLVFLFTRMNENKKRWLYVKRAENLIIKEPKSLQSIIDYKWLAFEYENEYTKTERTSLIDSMYLFINHVKKDALKYKANYEITQLYQGLEAYSYHKGELQNALTYIDSAIYYAKKIKGKKNISGLYLAKSWDYYDLKQFDNAVSTMDTVFYYSDKNDAGYIKLLPQAAEIYEGSGRLDKAYKSIKNYNKLNDSILNLKRIKIVNELETKYQTQLKDTKIKKQTIQLIVLVSIIIFILLIGAIIRLRYIRKKNQALTQAINRQKILEKELSDVRDEIAQDFHDDLGNRLARISLLSNLINQEKSLKNPKIKSKIKQITDDANGLYNGTRDFIFSLKSNSDYLEEVITYLSDFGESFFDKTNVKFKLEKHIESNIKLPHYWSKQLIYIFKEAMTNALKHSQCNKVCLSFTYKNNLLIITCNDNGIGIKKVDKNSTNGLLNMKNRGEKIKCEISITSLEEKGTSIKFKGFIKQT